MKVSHDQQRKSAERWMGCRQTYLTNSKRDEEFEDVVPDDEEDMYFEFETPSKASILAHKKLEIALVAIILTIMGKMT